MCLYQKQSYSELSMTNLKKLIFNALIFTSINLSANECGVFEFLEDRSNGIQISNNQCQSSNEVSVGTRFKLSASARLFLKSPSRVTQLKYGLICQNRGKQDVHFSIDSKTSPWIKNVEHLECDKWKNNQLKCRSSKDKDINFLCHVSKTVASNSKNNKAVVLNKSLYNGVAVIAKPANTNKAVERTTSVKMRVINTPSFSWPPPHASATTVLPRDILVKNNKKKTLSHINHILSKALEANGYNDKSYYSAPEGFVLVTKLEQINADGSPKDPPARWLIDVPPLTSFSLESYMKALFSAKIGYFRLLVFTVTSMPFRQTEESISRSAALKWLSNGLNVLPSEIGKQSFSLNHNVTVLIYEFEKIRGASKAELIEPGRLDGIIHLKTSRIIQEITE